MISLVAYTLSEARSNATRSPFLKGFDASALDQNGLRGIGAVINSEGSVGVITVLNSAVLAGYDTVNSIRRSTGRLLIQLYICSYNLGVIQHSSSVIGSSTCNLDGIQVADVVCVPVGILLNEYNCIGSGYLLAITVSLSCKGLGILIVNNLGSMFCNCACNRINDFGNLDLAIGNIGILDQLASGQFGIFIGSLDGSL